MYVQLGVCVCVQLEFLNRRELSLAFVQTDEDEGGSGGTASEKWHRCPPTLTYTDVQHSRSASSSSENSHSPLHLTLHGYQEVEHLKSLLPETSSGLKLMLPIAKA